MHSRWSWPAGAAAIYLLAAVAVTLDAGWTVPVALIEAALGLLLKGLYFNLEVADCCEPKARQLSRRRGLRRRDAPRREQRSAASARRRWANSLSACSVGWRTLLWLDATEPEAPPGGQMALRGSTRAGRSMATVRNTDFRNEWDRHYVMAVRRAPNAPTSAPPGARPMRSTSCSPRSSRPVGSRPSRTPSSTVPGSSAKVVSRACSATPEAAATVPLPGTPKPLTEVTRY